MLSNLAKADVSEQSVILKITGHSLTSSIKLYLHLHTDHRFILMQNFQNLVIQCENKTGHKSPFDAR